MNRVYTFHISLQSKKTNFYRLSADSKIHEYFLTLAIPRRVRFGEFLRSHLLQYFLSPHHTPRDFSFHFYVCHSNIAKGGRPPADVSKTGNILWMCHSSCTHCTSTSRVSKIASSVTCQVIPAGIRAILKTTCASSFDPCSCPAYKTVKVRVTRAVEQMTFACRLALPSCSADRGDERSNCAL